MSISNPNIIIGLALGLLLGAIIVIWRRHYTDVFSVLMVTGILGLAVVVTIYQVNQYRAQKAEASQLAAAQPSLPEPMSGSTSQPPARPPVAVPMLPPGVRGPSGAAAPPAAFRLGDGNP